MHIPDGFLSNRVWISFDLISGAGILYAARRLDKQISARIVPLMGVLSAFVFAAQLINFPIIGGTSGHLVGGALLGILLGPVAGSICMATVILAQALFLQDGGIAALGANIFNIGALSSFGGYAVFRLSGGYQPTARRLAISGFLAGWLSVVVSAIACALQLALSGVLPFRIGVAAMAGYHAVIGIAEGGLTAGVLVFAMRVRPDLVRGRVDILMRATDWIAAAALVALPCALLFLAGTSGLPDPLQKLLLGETPLVRANNLGAFSREREMLFWWGSGASLFFAAMYYLVSRLAHGGGRK